MFTGNLVDLKNEALEAEQRIRPYALETPLEYSRYLSRAANCNVYLKLENIQRTGSFKFRGAANFLLLLTEDDVKKGIITASTGNHAVAFAEMLEILGYKGTIFLPENTVEAKVSVLRTYDVNLKFVGSDTVETENAARMDALENHRIFVPPYNHVKIIGGQATIAVELQRQLEAIDAVFVPVGGGGIMSGISGYFKAVDKNILCIGCQPQQSPVMYESVKAGRIIEMESGPTLADGTAGGIEKDSITFGICRDNVDDYVVVSEEEIANAIRLMLEKHYMLVEGAAALSVASFLKDKQRFGGKNVVLIITGRKITPDKLKKCLPL